MLDNLGKKKKKTNKKKSAISFAQNKSRFYHSLSVRYFNEVSPWYGNLSQSMIPRNHLSKNSSFSALHVYELWLWSYLPWSLTAHSHLPGRGVHDALSCLHRIDPAEDEIVYLLLFRVYDYEQRASSYHSENGTPNYYEQL